MSRIAPSLASLPLRLVLFLVIFLPATSHARNFFFPISGDSLQAITKLDQKDTSSGSSADGDSECETPDLSGGFDSSGFDFASHITLPVEWLAFEVGQENEQDVALHWSTAIEINNEGFKVQRGQATGSEINWQDLEFVPGQGTSGQRSDYETVDYSPEEGLNYYRIVQQDFNGKETSSDVQSIQIGRLQSQATVYPNPTSDFLNLKLRDNGSHGKVNYQIVNTAGHLMNRGFVAPGSALMINLVELPSGQYFLRVQLGKLWEVHQFTKS